MNGAPAITYLFDVDNTLLDNDRVHDDFDRHLAAVFGAAGAKTYWGIYEARRVKLGYADYLGAVQEFRLECNDEINAEHLAAFLLDYPFAERLYPRALDAVAELANFGPVVALSDGDVVLQPRKIRSSGIARAMDDRVLIYIHKERMLDDVARRFPSDHYVMVDDKLRVLDGMKRQWRARLTTVFVRQGHYASDPVAQKEYPPADISLQAIGNLCGMRANDFLFPLKAATAAE